MDGVNYLVPVDARLDRDVDVRFETVTVDDGCRCRRLVRTAEPTCSSGRTSITEG